MPTLPLYAQTLTAGEPESWHRINAPGGYEVWQFVGCDAAHNRWVVASLSWGSTFLPRYLQRYERYRRRPTRVAPPVPKEHCSASFALYDGGRLLARFDIPVNGDEFAVSRGQAGISVGANRLSIDPDGRLHLHLRGVPWRDSWHGPTVLRDKTVAATLVFEPVATAPLREIELLNGESPIHRWAFSRPVCKVKGDISIFEPGATTPRMIIIDGRGCHDHAWGIRPLAWDFDQSLNGYVLDEGRTFQFERLTQRRSGTARSRIVGVDGNGARDVELESKVSRWRRIGINSRFPEEIRFGDLLTLSDPRVLESSRYEMRLTYSARWADQTGVALCHMVNWKKLRRAWLPVEWRARAGLPG